VNEPAGWEVTADPSSRRWGELFGEQAILHGPEGEEAWFIRGNIEIPVEDGTQLTYTAWLSISQQNFDRAHELWLDERRVQEPPYFAWRDRADFQNRQRVEPGVSSAVPTAVAVRGLTS
jgi:hypothetical protein